MTKIMRSIELVEAVFGKKWEGVEVERKTIDTEVWRELKKTELTKEGSLRNCGSRTRSMV